MNKINLKILSFSFLALGFLLLSYFYAANYVGVRKANKENSEWPVFKIVDDFSVPITVTVMAWSPDNKKLVVGCGLKSYFFIEDVNAQKIIKRIDADGGVNSFSYSHNGGLLAVARTFAGKNVERSRVISIVDVYDTEGWKLIRKIMPTKDMPHVLPDALVAFSPDGRYLAIGGYGSDHILAIYDMSLDKIVAVVDMSSDQKWYKGRIGALAYSPDGNYVAYTISERLKPYTDEHGWKSFKMVNRLVVVDTHTWSTFAKVSLKSSNSWSVSFSSNSNELAIGSGISSYKNNEKTGIESGVSVLSVPSLDRVKFIPIKNGSVQITFRQALRVKGFVGGGRFLLVAAKPMRLIDLKTNAVRDEGRIFQNFPDVDLSLSPDGQFIAVTDGDRVRVLMIGPGARG